MREFGSIVFQPVIGECHSNYRATASARKVARRELAAAATGSRQQAPSCGILVGSPIITQRRAHEPYLDLSQRARFQLPRAFAGKAEVTANLR